MQFLYKAQLAAFLVAGDFDFDILHFLNLSAGFSLIHVHVYCPKHGFSGLCGLEHDFQMACVNAFENVQMYGISMSAQF